MLSLLVDLTIPEDAPVEWVAEHYSLLARYEKIFVLMPEDYWRTCEVLELHSLHEVRLLLEARRELMKHYGSLKSARETREGHSTED